MTIAEARRPVVEARLVVVPELLPAVAAVEAAHGLLRVLFAELTASFDALFPQPGPLGRVGWVVDHAGITSMTDTKTGQLGVDSAGIVEAATAGT
jgi:hypothetical protein